MPHVGVLVYEQVDLLSMAAPAGVLQASDAARVFSVADTQEPVRSQGFQTLVPQFDFAHAPRIDVLVVPGGRGTRQVATDQLVLDWIRETAARARCVVTVGNAQRLLANAGVEAETGRVLHAPDATAGAQTALDVVCALTDEKRAQHVAEGLGIKWTPDPERAPLPPAPELTPEEHDETAAEPQPANSSPVTAAPAAAGAYSGFDWPQWRGPTGDGVSAETGWNEHGAPEPLWQAELGLGHSCVSVVGDRVYAIGFDQDQQRDVIRCLDADTGTEHWQHSYPGVIRNLFHGGGTLTTPAVRDGRLFVATREGELRCLDAATGELLWHRRVAADLELEGTEYGFGGSPLLVDELVVYHVAAVVALDARSGELVWRTEPLEAQYSTPVALDLDGEPLLASFTKKGLYVLDRRSGEQRHFHPWRKGPTTVNASTPVVLGDRIFISSGYDHGCALLQLGADGLRVLWQSRVMRNKLAGCDYHDGYLYGFDEGTLKCIGLDGVERWRKRGFGQGALSIAGGRLVVQGHRGDLVIATASPDGFRELTRRKVLSGGTNWTTPVVAHGRIYCRNSLGRLVCLDHRPR